VQHLTVLLLVLALLGGVAIMLAQTALHLLSTQYQRLAAVAVEPWQVKTGVMVALVEAAPKTVVLAVLLQVVKETLVVLLQDLAPMVLLVGVALALWVALAFRVKGEVMVE
jgi:hypothetical protein|tara:strand:+ start:339 stop:671 length:333 start_codon:yes stop_codon:yes gene_type:complete